MYNAYRAIEPNKTPHNGGHLLPCDSHDASSGFEEMKLCPWKSTWLFLAPAGSILYATSAFRLSPENLQASMDTVLNGLDPIPISQGGTSYLMVTFGQAQHNTNN
ncbi:hypothetical protein J1614_000416 [Plenodomus biglobosus]|nr:hypothetical protein J1614_000416 [Plenodomus biglobosus]